MLEGSPLALSYVFLVVLGAGIVRGATGFGFSLIAIVLLTLVYPPTQIAPTILLWEIAASIGHLPFVYRDVDWKSLRWLSLGIVFGTPLGVWFLVNMPVDLMRIVINAVVLILTAMLFYGLRPKKTPTSLATTAVGTLSGIINGASANGGPPVILFFLSSPAGAAVGRASLIAFFLFTDVLASLLYWKSGLVHPEILVFTGCFLVPLGLGVWMGNHWFARIDKTRFNRIVLILLMVIAGMALIQALLE